MLTKTLFTAVDKYENGDVPVKRSHHFLLIFALIVIISQIPIASALPPSPYFPETGYSVINYYGGYPSRLMSFEIGRNITNEGGSGNVFFNITGTYPLRSKVFWMDAGEKVKVWTYYSYPTSAGSYNMRVRAALPGDADIGSIRVVRFTPTNDSSTDIGVYRDGFWYLDYNNDGIIDSSFQFGLSGDIPLTGNWDGNSISDVGVFRPSTRQFIFNTSPVTRTTFGLSTDIPITGDWNNDGITDIGVFRPSARQFIFNTSPVTRTTFGLSTDIPITGDWNNDGITDIGVFRPSARQFIFNTSPVARTTFGLSTDIPITGDWDNDGITDIGVFRPSARQFIFNTSLVTRTTFGLSTDIPITGDWNNDGITDIGVFRPSAQQFIFNTSPVTRTTFGLSTDIPITGKWL
jgi:hypothetical protein